MAVAISTTLRVKFENFSAPLGACYSCRSRSSIRTLTSSWPGRDSSGSGTRSIGSSAGSIVACPSLKTTKDMPVVEPPSFEALGLVDFQISPHYLDPDPLSKHMGETQEQRIQQFLEENELPVVGLREGSFLRVEGGSTVLKGKPGARVFRRGHSPLEVQPGSELRELLFPEGSGR